MKKEIYRRINHVLRVLGAKKKEVIDARDESENAISAFLEPGEIPPIVEASEDIKIRFSNYMTLELQIDEWVERKHAEMTRQDVNLKTLMDSVHQDMQSFIEQIENI